MKKLFLVIMIALISVYATFSQDPEKRPTISVVGNAEVETMPDEVTFILDVTKNDKDLQIAKRQNDESVSKILELTRRFSIPAGNVKTDAISVEAKYQFIRDQKVRIVDEDGDETGKKIFLGYEVSKSVTVRLTDMSRFEEFFGEALKTGITEVSSVKFSTSKFLDIRIQAREMAMKAARDKAAAMAAAIGQRIGKAIFIQEGVADNSRNSSGYFGNFSANTAVRNATGPMPAVSTQSVTTTFAPGAIKVDSTVSVVFLLD